VVTITLHPALCYETKTRIEWMARLPSY